MEKQLKTIFWKIIKKFQIIGEYKITMIILKSINIMIKMTIIIVFQSIPMILLNMMVKVLLRL